MNPLAVLPAVGQQGGGGGGGGGELLSAAKPRQRKRVRAPRPAAAGGIGGALTARVAAAAMAHAHGSHRAAAPPQAHAHTTPAPRKSKDVMPPVLSSGGVASQRGLAGVLNDYRTAEFVRMRLGDEPPGSGKRLQVHQHLMEGLISQLKSYAPILGAIKQEYDAAFLGGTAEAAELNDLKTKLSISDLRHRSEMDNVRRDFAKDLAKQAKQLEHANKESQIVTASNGQLERQLLALNKSRGKMANEIQDTYQEQYFLAQAMGNYVVRANANEEGAQKFLGEHHLRVMAQELLEKQRRQMAAVEKKSTSKIEEMETVIAGLQQQLAEEKAGREAATGKLDHVDKNIRHMLQSFDVIWEQREGLHSKSFDMQSFIQLLFHTACSPEAREGVMEEGTGWNIEDGHAMSQDKLFKCHELVQSILAAADRRIVSSLKMSRRLPQEVLHFQPIKHRDYHESTEGTLPVFLDYDGSPLLNKRFAKVHVERVMKAMWTSKRSDPDSASFTMRMDKFFLHWLTAEGPACPTVDAEEGGLPTHPWYEVRLGPLQTERDLFQFAYNFHDSLKRYSHDPDIQAFLNILTGVIEEEVYVYDMDTMARMMNLMEEKELKIGAKRLRGKLTKEDFNAVMEGLPDHNSAENAAVLKAEVDRSSGAEVNYKTLLAENKKTGEQSLFVTLLRDQCQENRATFLQEFQLVHAHLAASGATAEERSKGAVISKEMGIKVFAELDPEKDTDEALKYCLRGFGDGSSWQRAAYSKRSFGKSSAEIDITDFIAAMGAGVLARSGPRSSLLLDLQQQLESDRFEPGVVDLQHRLDHKAA